MNPLRLSSNNISNTPCGFMYLHGGKDDPTTAFEINEKAKIIFKIPRALGALGVRCEIYNEALNECLNTYECNWSALDMGQDIYETKIDIRSLGVGIYFVRTILSSVHGEYYGNKYSNFIHFTKNPSIDHPIQLSVCDFSYPLPEAIYGGVIYHIFVDRFNRGGQASHPDTARLIWGKWDKIPEYPEYPGAPLKNNTFYGGTLYGIVDKLDYFSSLGVTAIYLSPIFESVSNHKYDTGNYMKVDEGFGGDEALTLLIRECNKRNIKIILDGVFNHTGADSIYFNRLGRYNTLGAYQSENSPYYSWYEFQEHPNKFTCWWDIEILPRINPDKQDCREYFVGSSGVLNKYTKMGIYGFRLDVADELSDDFIADIKSTITNGKQSILYGEVWEDASNKIAYDTRKKYYLGKELDGVMNYPLRSGLIEYLLYRKTDKLSYALDEVLYNAHARIRNAQMNLLGTHDTERIITVLGGKESNGRSNSELRELRMTKKEKELGRARLMAAYTVLATLPGVPAIFYGDEVGLEGYHDPFNRMPYPWGNEDGDLLLHYRTIGEIRTSASVYAKGDFKLYLLTPQLLVFSRIQGSWEYLTVFNNGDSSVTVSFDVGVPSLVKPKTSKKHILSPIVAEIFKIKTITQTEIT